MLKSNSDKFEELKVKPNGQLPNKLVYGVSGFANYSFRNKFANNKVKSLFLLTLYRMILFSKPNPQNHCEQASRPSTSPKITSSMVTLSTLDQR